MNAFHMIGLTHAFWNAVVVNRGGSQSERLERRVDEHDAEAEAEVHDRLGLGLVQGATASLMSCAVCAIAASATIRIPLRRHALRRFFR